MTENEAIQGFKMDNVLLGDNDKGTVERNNLAIKALEEIQQYRAIGTVDECRTAVERMRPKRVMDISEVKDGKEYFGLIGKCPCCNSIVGEDNLVCEDCFQVLDWSKENE